MLMLSVPARALRARPAKEVGAPDLIDPFRHHSYKWCTKFSVCLAKLPRLGRSQVISQNSDPLPIAREAPMVQRA
jgi:hypothetical protein